MIDAPRSPVAAALMCAVVGVAVSAALASLPACGLPCGLGGRCVDGEGAVGVEGEGEGGGDQVICTSSTSSTFNGPPFECEFTLTSCSDDNEYTIRCPDAHNCECRRSNADGTLDSTGFTIDASCDDFDAGDSSRFNTFANTNCGWDLGDGV